MESGNDDGDVFMREQIYEKRKKTTENRIKKMMRKTEKTDRRHIESQHPKCRRKSLERNR